MKVAFIGAGGTGKTTMAQLMAERFGFDYNVLSTQSFMPEGIKSHQDVMRLACNNPEEGIKFQQALIESRHTYYRNPELRGKSGQEHIVSDRTAMDSFIYYLIQNSAWGTDLLASVLEKKAVENLLSFDAVFWPFCSDMPFVEDNGVRQTNKAYNQMFESVLHGVLHKHFHASEVKMDGIPYQTYGDNIYLMNGISSLEDRMSFVKDILVL